MSDRSDSPDAQRCEKMLHTCARTDRQTVRQADRQTRLEIKILRTIVDLNRLSALGQTYETRV